MRLLIILTSILVVSGCTTYGTVDNQRLAYYTDVTDLYSLASTTSRRSDGKYTIFIAMSGGGTRAAALSYGVLKGLKEEMVNIDGVQTSLLEEVDFISAVSGGSFTAAYYGLHGDKLFTNFEEDFLYHDVGSDLFWRAVNPALWFSFSGRTDETISYYQQYLFEDATFADIDTENSPLIIINATDLARGVRFSFTQEYFNLLCSNISSYPIASAVAASAAVPVVFNPVVLKNHTGCGNQALLNLTPDAQSDELKKSVIKGLNSYANKEGREYVHLVDGGITDNLGLLAMYDIMNVSGDRYREQIRSDIKPHTLAISIDASTTPTAAMDHSPKEPSISETISFMTDIQIHRLNDVSKNLYKQQLQRFEESKQISTYFVDINLSDVEEPDLRDYLNSIPTDLELESEQVDALVKEGIEQLKNNDDFMRFLRNIK